MTNLGWKSAAGAFDIRLSMLIAATEQELGIPESTLPDEKDKLIANFHAMQPKQKTSFRELIKQSRPTGNMGTVPPAGQTPKSVLPRVQSARKGECSHAYQYIK
ncbi:MAG: hypothetical protein WC091_16055 [Sulfuricellaceae bacterium]